jgi:hypothetical protein
MRINKSTDYTNSPHFGAKLIVKSEKANIHNLLIHLASDFKKQGLNARSFVDDGCGSGPDGLFRTLITSQDEETVLSSLENASLPALRIQGRDMWEKIGGCCCDALRTIQDSAEVRIINEAEELKSLDIFKGVKLDIPNA